jgi:hypothetical protein
MKCKMLCVSKPLQAMLGVRLKFDVIDFDLAVECSVIHPEQLGRLALVAARDVEGAANQFDLEARDFVIE